VLVSLAAAGMLVCAFLAQALLASTSAPPAWLSTAAGTIRSAGFVVLPCTVPSDRVVATRSAVSRRLDRLLRAAQDAGLDPIEQQYVFQDITHRRRLRWDFQMPNDCSAWKALVNAAVNKAMPLFEELCDCDAVPRVVMSGAVVSRRGAGLQSFHTDGGRGLFTLFVPLVDIQPDADGTQFWPGTHLDDEAPMRSRELTEDAAEMAEMVAPGCAAGGLLCFDYRVLHRGLPNVSRERAVAYVVVATERDAVDNNFPSTLSVFDANPAITAAMPYWVGDAAG
jgi:uncharacterized protein YfcZ (UPF0381/DUF406 family)